MSFPMRPWFRAPGMGPKSLPQLGQWGPVPKSWGLGVAPHFPASKTVYGVGAVRRQGQRMCQVTEAIVRPRRQEAGVQVLAFSE